MLAKFLRLLDTRFPQTAGAVLFLLTGIVYGGLMTNAFLYVGVLLHACNALLVALILRQLLRGRTWVALVCGALFAASPLHVHIVAALGVQDKLPSALFALLCIWSYLRYCESEHRYFFLYALGFYALALLGNPSLLTLPLALLIMEWRIGTRHRRGLWLDMLPFLAGSVAAGIVLAPALVPPPLSSETILVAIAVGALIGTANRMRDIAFGAGFFLILLAPALFAFGYDPWPYAATLGLLFIIGWMLNRMAGRLHSALVPALASVACIALLACATVVHVWQLPRTTQTQTAR